MHVLGNPKWHPVKHNYSKSSVWLAITIVNELSLTPQLWIMYRTCFVWSEQACFHGDESAQSVLQSCLYSSGVKNNPKTTFVWNTQLVLRSTKSRRSWIKCSRTIWFGGCAHFHFVAFNQLLHLFISSKHIHSSVNHAVTTGIFPVPPITSLTLQAYLSLLCSTYPRAGNIHNSWCNALTLSSLRSMRTMAPFVWLGLIVS